MAYNNSPDSEFDPEMERVLREHFDAESGDLSSPTDPWNWLESRMEEPQAPSFLTRLFGAVAKLWQVRPSPAFAGASVAVVAVAVAVAVWAVSAGGGPEPSGGMAAVPPTEAPVLGPIQTVLPAGEDPGEGESAVANREEPPTDSADSPAVTRVSSPPTPVVSTTQPPVSPPAVPPTESAMVMMEEVAEEESEAVTTQSVGVAKAVPTPAPYATQAPARAASSGPPGQSGQMSVKAGSPPPVSPPSIGSGTPPATTFRDYQRQPFVAAAEDNVSTFSLDTDRTSYQLALSWARAGFEVEPDSVRAEEWLNAFNYEYDQPSNQREFAVTSDLFPHPLDEDKRLARIAFQASELVVDKPLNVTLVLDASGSMADGDRVGIARQAAESLRLSLRPNDRIAVVHFTDNVIANYTVQHTHPDDSQVSSSIAWLRPHGSTNVQAGLNLGVRMAGEVRSERPDAYNYVILMSDGVANVDATDPFAILETAYDPDSRNPLRLITIGVGINNYNDPLLEQLAQHGNGWYRYLGSTQQAQATFARDNWLSLSIPFADQTRAQVTWNPETVERWRIVGYENRVTADENFTQDRKEFAEVYSGAATTVLYELELTQAAVNIAHVELGIIELRWVDPDTGDSRTQTATLSGNPSADFAGKDGSLAQFGTIAALAADSYSLLSGTDNEESVDVHAALSALQTQLRTLESALGGLDSYKDFSFLLNHLADDIEDRLPPSTRSGYSP